MTSLLNTVDISDSIHLLTVFRFLLELSVSSVQYFRARSMVACFKFL